MSDILIGCLIGAVAAIPMFLAGAELNHRRKVRASQREYWKARRKELGLSAEE